MLFCPLAWYLSKVQSQEVYGFEGGQVIRKRLKNRNIYEERNGALWSVRSGHFSSVSLKARRICRSCSREGVTNLGKRLNNRITSLLAITTKGTTSGKVPALGIDDNHEGNSVEQEINTDGGPIIGHGI